MHGRLVYFAFFRDLSWSHGDSKLIVGGRRTIEGNCEAFNRYRVISDSGNCLLTHCLSVWPNDGDISAVVFDFILATITGLNINDDIFDLINICSANSVFQTWNFGFF